MIDCANNTTLSCFFCFFLFTDWYFLILAAIAQIFYPIAKLEMSIGISIQEAKTKVEINLVIVEAKIRKCSI